MTDYTCMKCREIGPKDFICSCMAHKLWLMSDKERRRWFVDRRVRAAKIDRMLKKGLIH